MGVLAKRTVFAGVGGFGAILKYRINRLFVPKGYHLNIKTVNMNKSLKKTPIDDFDMYEILLKNPEKIKR